MAGNSSVPALRHLVQAVHAGGGLLGHADDALGDRASSAWRPRRASAGAVRGRRANSSVSARRGSGTDAGRSNSTPLCTSSVASPPSSRIMFGAGPARASAAPARCTTSTPRASRPSRRRPARRPARRRCRRARRRWPRPRGPGWRRCCSDAQRTCAPRATSVSMSTAVCTVMCSEPVIRAPASGLLSPYSARMRHEARHLVLGEPDLLASELGQREVGDLEVERRRPCAGTPQAAGGFTPVSHPSGVRDEPATDPAPSSVGSGKGLGTGKTQRA